MIKNYPGKILLFGEYSILYGTKGLVLPFSLFSGEWLFSQNTNNPLGSELENFYQFSSKTGLKIHFNFKLFKQDIKKGLIFSSSIPTGAGLGSSGALIAAFYDRYAIQKQSFDNQGVDLNSIREDLAQLESYHHHKSSGIDPLVSWLQRPILLRGLRDIVVLNQFDGHATWLKKNNFKIFLIPTETSRSTGDWVHNFKLKQENTLFKKWFEKEYCPLVDNVVASFLSMDNSFFTNIFTLCLHQCEMMNDFMNVPVLKNLKDMIQNTQSAIKLCGAGGGGFFLLFTHEKNFQTIQEKFNLIPVF